MFGSNKRMAIKAYQKQSHSMLFLIEVGEKELLLSKKSRNFRLLLKKPPPTCTE